MANLAELVVIVNDLHRKLPKKQTPLTIPDIQSVIEVSTETKIDIAGPDDWDDKSLWGIFLKYPGKAAVLIKPDLNTCHRRFVSCKEMAHLLVDRHHPEHTTIDPLSLVEVFFSTVIQLDAPMASEVWAWRAAIEILVPWGSRAKITEMINSEAPNVAIAKAYMVPEHIIEVWRSKKYQDEMTHAWADTDKIEFEMEQ